MVEAAGDREELRNTLIQAIEEKASHLEYKAGREGMYAELERRLPEKHYYRALSIIDHGYYLLEGELTMRAGIAA